MFVRTGKYDIHISFLFLGAYVVCIWHFIQNTTYMQISCCKNKIRRFKRNSRRWWESGSLSRRKEQETTNKTTFAKVCIKQCRSPIMWTWFSSLQLQTGNPNKSSCMLHLFIYYVFKISHTKEQPARPISYLLNPGSHCPFPNNYFLSKLAIYTAYIVYAWTVIHKLRFQVFDHNKSLW